MKQKLLDLISNRAAICTDCELHKGRIKSVFGSGNPDANIVVCGEAAGKEENLTGLPFVGRAGKLLTNMLKSIDLDRDKDVYILNTVCCRPPNNRKPELDEIEACRFFLDMQLTIINPKLIIALGGTAAETLCGSGPGITKRHGNVEKYKNTNVLITFHPAALLRNPDWKKLAWCDLQKVKELV